MYSGFKVETHDVLPRADEEMVLGMEVKQEHQAAENSCKLST